MARRKYEIRERYVCSDGSIYHVNAHTEKEKKQKIAAHEKKIHEVKAVGRRFSAGKNILIEQVYEEWVDEKRKKASPQYKQLIKTRIEKHIIPTFGKMTFAEIDTDMIDEFFDDLTSKNIKKGNSGNEEPLYSDGYIKKIKTDLNFLFKTAIKEKYISTNPIADLIPDEGRKQRDRRPATNEEVELLRQVADKDDRFVFFLVMAYCGLRNSEVARLKIGDIETIRDKDFFHVRGTKSSKADRLVPIPDILWFSLPLKSTNKDDYIFQLTTNHSHRVNDYYDASAQRRLWLECKKQMNIQAGCKTYKGELVPPLPVAEDLTPYCFRHSFATKLHLLQMPLDYRKYLLGHAQISTTIDVYTQLGIATAEDIAVNLDFNKLTDIYKL